MSEKITDYTPQIEQHLADTAERCECLAWVHKRSEAYFSEKSTYLDIPVIILSTIAGATSIGSSSLFPDDSKMASVGIGIISIGVGILQTINQQFSFSRRAESHKLAFVQYSKLYRHIKIQLALARNVRLPARELLQRTKDEYDRLAENSPLLTDTIVKQFKTRFKEYTEVTRPEELNGLEKVEIFDVKWGKVKTALQGVRRLSVEVNRPEEIGVGLGDENV